MMISIMCKSPVTDGVVGVAVGVAVDVAVGGGVGEGGGIISGKLLVLPSTVAYCPHSQHVTEPFLMIQ